ncbi:unnamed protein product, partial [Thlaspi arvense]
MEAEAVGGFKDTAASVEASTVFPGFKFSPTDVELISYYLKRKMDGLERSVEVIPDADIYNFEPWDLPGLSSFRFFLLLRTCSCCSWFRPHESGRNKHSTYYFGCSEISLSNTQFLGEDKSIVKSETEWFFFCARGKKYPHGSQNRRATKMGYWKATGKERDVKSGSEVIGTKRTLVFHTGRAPKGERTEWLMHEYCMKGVSLDDAALVVCRLKRNKEFQSCTNQKARAPHSAPEKKHTILQNGAAAAASGSPSDLDDMVDFYRAGESGVKLVNEMAATAEDLQVHTEDDFFADILRDEIINLDEMVMSGSTSNEVPTLESASMSIRVLPLPNMIDKQMASLVEAIPSQEKSGKESNGTESLSSCFVGLYSIKTVNRARWNVIICVVALTVLLFFLERFCCPVF